MIRLLMYYLKENGIPYFNGIDSISIIMEETADMEECPICGDDFTENSKDEIFTLACKHTYYCECIMLEIQNNSHSRAHHCPYCRTPIKNIPLCSNQIPVKGLHKEYQTHKGQSISYDVFKKYLQEYITSKLNNNKPRCKALVYTEQLYNNSLDKAVHLTINNTTRQCNRSKMANHEHFCSIHKNKYGNISIEDIKYYFP